MKSLFIFLLLNIVYTYEPQVFVASKSNTIAQTSPENSKTRAFEVLKKKCNTCHRIRNPSKKFSIDNMDSFAPLIYKQVFVLKRMPKGQKRRRNMTSEELDRIKIWLDETINLNN